MIRGVWGETWSQRPFLLHQYNDWGILVFGTNRTVTVMRRCQCLFIDGTFCTTLPYEQLMTVHSLYNEFVIPLLFCLLTGKTVGSTILIAAAGEMTDPAENRLQPQRMVLDFDRSLILAVETKLQRCRIYACYFHFTQSMNVQYLSLAYEYKHNADQESHSSHYGSCVRVSIP